MGKLRRMLMHGIVPGKEVNTLYLHLRKQRGRQDTVRGIPEPTYADGDLLKDFCRR